MNDAIEAIVQAIVAFLKSVNTVLSAVPGLIWAIALLGVVMWGGLMHLQRDSARSERDVIKETYEVLAKKVIRQNAEAAELLKKLTVERDALQKRLDNATDAQRKKDAENAKTIAAQAARLRALAAAAPGGQLRDPNARTGDCGAGPKGDAATAAGNREEHTAETGGLLSAQLSGLLIRLTGEADGINAAYESARADALMCRQAAGESP